MNDYYLDMTLKTELLQMPELLEACIEKYLKDNELRCYQKPVKVNGWPFGYAQTFKVIKVKRRKENEKII